MYIFDWYSVGLPFWTLGWYRLHKLLSNLWIVFIKVQFSKFHINSILLNWHSWNLSRIVADSSCRFMLYLFLSVGFVFANVYRLFSQFFNLWNMHSHASIPYISILYTIDQLRESLAECFPCLRNRHSSITRGSLICSVRSSPVFVYTSRIHFLHSTFCSKEVYKYT